MNMPHAIFIPPSETLIRAALGTCGPITGKYHLTILIPPHLGILPAPVALPAALPRLPHRALHLRRKAHGPRRQA